MMSLEVRESSPVEKYELKKYSYADYLTLDDETRVELIEGIPYDMTPGLRFLTCCS